MESKPSFRERIELLQAAARELDVIAATIIAEVERMEAAEKRFATRKGTWKRKSPDEVAAQK